jgi:hypothetical protein
MATIAELDQRGWTNKIWQTRKGTQRCGSPDACRKNRKRRELLSQSLQRFFDIDGEPIELTDDLKGWCCVFKVQIEQERSMTTFSE